MSPYLEFEGKNVDKATENACEKLNLTVEKLKYDVISYGSTGIFGLVRTKKAKIRVEMPVASQTDIPEDNIKETPAEQKKEISDSQTTANQTAQIETSSPSHDPEPAVSLEDPAKFGKNILQRIIDFITTDAKISVAIKSNRILFNVTGGNSAVLIGKRGQTLEAIQYLVEKIVNKQHEQRIRIQIDIEGYLESRRDNLIKLAERQADKAKSTKRPATLGQMNAHDRRIVHLALKKDTGVRTQSIGDGFLRKLVIFPKKNNIDDNKDKHDSA